MIRKPSPSMRRVFLLLFPLVWGVNVWSAWPAWAQSSPLLDAPDRLVLPDFEVPGNRQRHILPPLDLPKVPSTPGYAGGTTILVESIVFHGNRVLDDGELRSIAAPWLGRELSYAEIAGLRDALTLAYVDRGFVSSGATVPQQEVKNGVLRIEIVEGVLAGVDYEIEGRLRPSLVGQGMIRKGQAVNLSDIEDRLRVIEQDPRVASVAARVVPGERNGESRLILRVIEDRPYWAEASVGNTTSPTVGSIGGGLRAGHRNVFGFSDEFELGYRATKGLQSISASYSVPVSLWGTRLAFRYSQGWSDVIEGSLRFLEIESRTRTLGFTLRQPVYRSMRQSASVFLSAEHRQAKSLLFGSGATVLAEGSDDGETSVSVVRGGAEWMWRNASQALALRATASFGVDTLGATINSGPLPDGEFTTGLFQAQWAGRFTPWDLQVITRVDGQVSDSRLLGLERFAVGGNYSIRGYRENQLVRDEGVVGSVELRVPVWRDPGRDLEVALATFIDLGGAWNKGRDLGRSTIGSAGLGVRVAWRPWVAAQLYWGQAFWEIDDEPTTTEQDQGVHFLLTFRPDWDRIEGWF